MPIIRMGQRFPAWCELREFEIIKLGPGERRLLGNTEFMEKLIVAEGTCFIVDGDDTVPAERGAQFDYNRVTYELGSDHGAIVVRMIGHWGQEVGGSGLFQVENAVSPQDGGDPVDYVKTTSFDSHYHDCDEYWIIYEGRGLAVSEGRIYEVKAGDCVATGTGHHHDFPQVHEPVKAVYFETTLLRQKRVGHLWNHTHGPAEPDPERV